ncbi:MAG TPA: beta-galactosidase [Candidatus Hydrogenedentes bacterium]|nr:beta-galactosidase [Candidatus Hydrogenedentota bacterium]
MGKRMCLCAAVLLLGIAPTSLAEVTREQLDQLLDSRILGWRWHLGDAPGAEQAGFDDSQWQAAGLGFEWRPHDSTGWFRVRVTVPEQVNGIPAKGAVIRMKAGVDNGAKAYVNGVFRQEFEWANGDFVLTENAQPGETITVALQAVNRAGYGKLYETYLVCSASEAMVDALRALVKDLDAAVQDAAYVPGPEAAHWRVLVQEAIHALDMTAYQACNPDAFLASVAAARDILLSDRAGLEERLGQTARQLAALKERLSQGRAAGRDMAYPAADARVVESFLQYVRDDLAASNFTHQLRGLKAAAYLDRVCAGAIREAELLVSDAAPGLSAPRYETAPVTIRNGAFWQHDRPVYFTGVGHFGQVRNDIPILNEYGLNIIQIEMGPSNGLPDSSTVDVNAIRENVVRWLDRAAEHNVAVNLLISPHYFPQWAKDADPAHGLCGEGFLKFCIEAPNTRPVMEKWLDALMPLIAGHPALHSICLSNEPQYKGKCAYERALFQTWLKEKWGPIQAANDAYGTGFRQFEDVELAKDASCGYGLFFDACRFNQEQFLAFHEMLRERIHRYAPDLPVHAKVMSHAFEDPGRFEVGIDYERFNQIDRIAGNDCTYAFRGEQPGPYACEWLNMAMNYSLQHCTAPDNPIFNSENHLIADGDARYMPESYIRTVYWHEALHGQGATTTWVWERAQDGDFAENILTRANCVRALGRVALDLNRLAPEVYALSRAKAPLAVLYAYSSLLPSMDYVEEARAAFEGTYFTGAVCDFVTERQIEAGALAQYKLVIVPRAAHTPDAVMSAFQEYIGAGGVVMTVGPCFTHDEYGRVRSQGLVQSGSGRLVDYPDPLTPQAYRDVIDRLLDAACAARPLRLVGPYGEPVWGVNVRAAEHRGRLLVSVLNVTRESRPVRLVAETPIQRAVDLINREEVTFPLTVLPMEPVLLALEPVAVKDGT